MQSESDDNLIGATVCAIRRWKLFSIGQFSLLAHAHCASSDSEHEIASDICQPVTQRAHVYHTKKNKKPDLDPAEVKNYGADIELDRSVEAAGEAGRSVGS